MNENIIKEITNYLINPIPISLQRDFFVELLEGFRALKKTKKNHLDFNLIYKNVGKSFNNVLQYITFFKNLSNQNNNLFKFYSWDDTKIFDFDENYDVIFSFEIHNTNKFCDFFKIENKKISKEILKDIFKKFLNI